VEISGCTAINVIGTWTLVWPEPDRRKRVVARGPGKTLTSLCVVDALYSDETWFAIWRSISPADPVGLNLDHGGPLAASGRSRITTNAPTASMPSRMRSPCAKLKRV